MLAWKLPNGQLRQVEEGSTLLEVAKSLAGTFASPVVEGIFNNEAIDLQKPLFEDGSIDFIEVNTEEGMRVYTRTLLFMLLVSAKRLRPDVALEVRNTLGSALYCVDHSSQKLTEGDIKAIEGEMRKMVEQHTPITLQRNGGMLLHHFAHLTLNSLDVPLGQLLTGMVNTIKGAAQGIAHLQRHIRAQSFSAHQKHKEQGASVNPHPLFRIHFDKVNAAILK